MNQISFSHFVVSNREKSNKQMIHLEQIYEYNLWIESSFYNSHFYVFVDNYVRLKFLSEKLIQNGLYY